MPTRSPGCSPSWPRGRSPDRSADGWRRRARRPAWHAATDGESARAAKRNTAAGCAHVVTAWATENRLVLGQAGVPDGSNEVGAIPDPLRALGLSGAIATIDAAGCQTEDARLIRSRGGHHLPAVKDNRPNLRAAVERVVEAACEAGLVGMDGGRDRW